MEFQSSSQTFPKTSAKVGETHVCWILLGQFFRLCGQFVGSTEVQPLLNHRSPSSWPWNGPCHRPHRRASPAPIWCWVHTWNGRAWRIGHVGDHVDVWEIVEIIGICLTNMFIFWFVMSFTRWLGHLDTQQISSSSRTHHLLPGFARPKVIPTGQKTLRL